MKFERNAGKNVLPSALSIGDSTDLQLTNGSGTTEMR